MNNNLPTSSTVRIETTIDKNTGQFTLVAWRAGSLADCLGVKKTFFASRVPAMRERMMKRLVKAEARRLAALVTVTETVTL